MFVLSLLAYIYMYTRFNLRARAEKTGWRKEKQSWFFEPNWSPCAQRDLTEDEAEDASEFWDTVCAATPRNAIPLGTRHGPTRNPYTERLQGVIREPSLF